MSIWQSLRTGGEGEYKAEGSFAQAKVVPVLRLIGTSLTFSFLEKHGNTVDLHPLFTSESLATIESSWKFLGQIYLL